MTPPAHGGQRSGAGRPAIGDAPRVTLSFTADPGNAAWLRSEAKRRKVSMSQVINEALCTAQAPAAPCGDGEQ